MQRINLIARREFAAKSDHSHEGGYRAAQRNAVRKPSVRHRPYLRVSVDYLTG